MNRLSAVILSAVTVLAPASVSGSAVAQQNTLNERLVAAWRLISAVVALVLPFVPAFAGAN